MKYGVSLLLPAYSHFIYTIIKMGNAVFGEICFSIYEAISDNFVEI